MQNRNYRPWIEIALFVVISAAIYLPFVSQFGYYNDDWYSMYAARVGGTQTFHEMYSLDRPGRAYVMIPLFNLFQGDPLYYNILAYVFRVLGAVCFLWMLRLVWQDKKTETFLTAFLFLIYPGFLSMPNGIDFQSHLIALCLVFRSIGMSLRAVQVGGKRAVFLWIGSLLTGWAYLSQMEYYIGFEAARLLLMGILVLRGHPGWKPAIYRTGTVWLPYLPVPLFYLIWRIFFFTSERSATDISLQLGTLRTEPIPTLYDWAGHFIQSFLNVTLFAWGEPLSQSLFTLDRTHMIRGIALGVAVMLVSLIVLHLFIKSETVEKMQNDQ